MSRLILYRGISVPRQDSKKVIREICTNGLTISDKSFWQFKRADIRLQAPNLFNKLDLTTKDTRISKEYFPVMCACGDRLGASHYAVKHNRDSGSEKVGIIISFSASLESIYIDGRDFLYTCFQLWDRETSKYFEKQKQALCKIFGKEIEKYFLKSASSSKAQYRIAMCDLACQNLKLIQSYANNKVVLGGRHDTVFCSSFFVKIPVSPDNIIEVKPIKQIKFIVPQLTLRNFLKGNL